MINKAWLSFGLVCILGLALALLGVAYGSVDIPMEAIWLNLTDPQNQDLSDTHHAIIWSLRMPRVAMAVLVGIALGISGCSLQGLFQNPLADPYVLGIASGGSLGAVLALVFASGGSNIAVAPAYGAFLGAALTAVVVYRLALTPMGLSLNAVLLAGVAIGLVCSALLTLCLLNDPSHTAQILGWLMGHLGGSEWSEVWVVFGCTAIGFLMVGHNHLTLDVLLLGEEAASGLGVDVSRHKILLLTACAILTAGAVAYCGVIGFVGLIVPHASRFLVGSEHRRLLPMSACLGATLLLGADLGARTISPAGEIPVGVITGCAGGLFFLILLRRGLAHD